MEYRVRKKICLNSYDYSQIGVYYITICTKDRYHLLGSITVGADSIRPHQFDDRIADADTRDCCEMKQDHASQQMCNRATTRNIFCASEYGQLVENAICAIPNYYDTIKVDRYCIVPNHVHLLLVIGTEGSGRILSAPTVSTVIGSMKRWVSKQIGFSIWQKSFYDTIVRSDKAYAQICNYIEGHL